MLPRLAVYRHRSGIRHLTVVSGDEYKPLCVRNPMRRGRPVDASPNCNSCLDGGWTRDFVYGVGGPKLRSDDEYRSVASLFGGLQ